MIQQKTSKNQVVKTTTKKKATTSRNRFEPLLRTIQFCAGLGFLAYVISIRNDIDPTLSVSSVIAFLGYSFYHR